MRINVLKQKDDENSSYVSSFSVYECCICGDLCEFSSCVEIDKKHVCIKCRLEILKKVPPEWLYEEWEERKDQNGGEPTTTIKKPKIYV
jgi:hypothetical protein